MNKLFNVRYNFMIDITIPHSWCYTTLINLDALGGGGGSQIEPSPFIFWLNIFCYLPFTKSPCLTVLCLFTHPMTLIM